MSPERLRIVSYNVRYFSHAVRGLGSTRASRRGISAALAALRPVPDLVCLQEVETRSIRSGIGRPPKHPGETQLEAFMGSLEEHFVARGEALPFEAFYFRAHVYKLLAAKLYTTGLAVLVNTKRLKVETHNVDAPYGITHHHVQRFKDRKQSRICAHLSTVTPSGRRLHVFNTHLSLPTPFASAFWKVKDKMGFGVNQLQEAQKLAAFVSQHANGDPYVLCGDFNSPPASPVYRCLREELGAVCGEEECGILDAANPRAFPTAGFLRLRMHLDHLFAGNGVRWRDLDGTEPFGKGPFHGLSDHMPLIGTFEVPRPG